jgi:hypothetical protein
MDITRASSGGAVLLCSGFHRLVQRCYVAILVQVGCINKTHRPEPHERIRAIGGLAGGARWKLREEEAIQEIRRERYTFYVERPPGVRVNVIIASHLGRDYLTTEADGLQPDNLLALPECPL